MDETSVGEPEPSPDPNPAREDLEPAERVELLTNRCFIHCLKQHDNRWPYDDTYTESSDAT